MGKIEQHQNTRARTGPCVPGLAPVLFPDNSWTTLGGRRWVQTPARAKEMGQPRGVTSISQ